MATSAQTNERSGSVVESHKGYDPRTLFFYFAVAAMMLYVVIGIARTQLFKVDEYHEMERQQNQRRILIPGPRGNIYDREGRLLVGNRPRFAVSIHLDELRGEFLTESRRVRKNYRELGDKDIPSSSQMAQIARYSVVQSYLDRINQILGRNEKVDSAKLSRHFGQNLLLPFTLIEDLGPEDYAKLLEQLPVKGPVQVYASSARYYPYKSAAAHLLGYVQANDELPADAMPGEDLATFKMRGTIGKIGIEAEYDQLLQGETGGIIYRVDPSGYRVDPPLDRRLPVQGRNFTTSIDVDIQMAAEAALEANLSEEGDRILKSAAVAIDVRTGEVLAIASKPDFDLNAFSPRLSTAAAKSIEDNQAWMNRAITGLYPPGSTFKILTSIAGLRAGAISGSTTVECEGHYRVGARSFPCHGGHAHGVIGFRQAIAKSCNIFFYDRGLAAGIDAISAEAQRFHFDRRTGIEVPNETRGMVVPSPAWKKRTQEEPWYPGDTANTAIGQGFVLVTPLQMACFTASLARGETFTQPTIEYHANRATQHQEPIGLTPAQTTALREGMEECIKTGTGKMLAFNFPYPIRVAGKTGTAQKRTEKGTINFAWFICYAPVEKPEIAIAIMIEGDKPDDEYGGGTFAAPVAGRILSSYFEKKKPKAPPIKAPTLSLSP